MFYVVLFVVLECRSVHSLLHVISISRCRLIAYWSLSELFDLSKSHASLPASEYERLALACKCAYFRYLWCYCIIYKSLSSFNGFFSLICLWIYFSFNVTNRVICLRPNHSCLLTPVSAETSPFTGVLTLDCADCIVIVRYAFDGERGRTMLHCSAIYGTCLSISANSRNSNAHRYSVIITSCMYGRVSVILFFDATNKFYAAPSQFGGAYQDQAKFVGTASHHSCWSRPHKIPGVVECRGPLLIRLHPLALQEISVVAVAVASVFCAITTDKMSRNNGNYTYPQFIQRCMKVRDDSVYRIGCICILWCSHRRAGLSYSVRAMYVVTCLSSGISHYVEMFEQTRFAYHRRDVAEAFLLDDSFDPFQRLLPDAQLMPCTSDLELLWKFHMFFRIVTT